MSETVTYLLVGGAFAFLLAWLVDVLQFPKPRRRTHSAAYLQVISKERP